jgi:hypothetical protein
MKSCIACKEAKPLSDYYEQSNAADGRAGVCRTCHKARMKFRRLTNPYVQAYDRLRYQTPERRAQGAANAKRWRATHPEAYRAQTAVNNAVRDGRLQKGICAICNAIENVHGHHKDYGKQLDVVWLCAKCHLRIHVAFPELGGHHP